MLSGLDNPLHWLVVLGVVLLVFGPKRLPEIGRSLGSGIRSFRESISGAETSDGPDQEETPKAPPSA
jgi:sec-independent protein translocase protein TatA